MNKFKILLFALLLCSFVNAKPAGDEAGNGGDVAYCNKSAVNELEGYYVIDHLIALNTNMFTLYDFKQSELDQRMNEVMTNISKKSSFLAATLKAFYRDFKDQLIKGGKETFTLRKWVEVYSALKDINDEDLAYSLPKNCLQLKQAVFRKKVGNLLNYFVHRKELLKSLSPKNFSWLIVHEFLWDFTEEVEVIRQVNAYFHSNELLSDSKKIFEQRIDDWSIGKEGKKKLYASGTFPRPILSTANFVPLFNGDEIKMYAKYKDGKFLKSSLYGIRMVKGKAFFTNLVYKNNSDDDDTPEKDFVGGFYPVLNIGGVSEVNFGLFQQRVTEYRTLFDVDFEIEFREDQLSVKELFADYDFQVYLNDKVIFDFSKYYTKDYFFSCYGSEFPLCVFDK
ncbi:hypothetical protein N9N67_07205, partial [Bacteriovoracaceae bacterium]|nr:hypothetical protein [Bacteriovoracaceae bacterium]